MTSEQLQRLDCLVACVVMGQRVFIYPQQDVNGHIFPEQAFLVDESGIPTTSVPRYSHSLDALSEALDAFYKVEVRFSANERIYVSLNTRPPHDGRYLTSAATLPVALCLALLRAHGVRIGTVEESERSA